VSYLNGIDISKWQTTTPSLSGQSFVFVRATYALTTDPRYAKHTTIIRWSPGIVVGAYHFGVGFVPPVEQAQAFLAVAKGADLLALDLEKDSTETMTTAQARAFIAEVHKAGRKIGLYHSRSGFPSLGQDWNWIAQWGTTPPNMPWAFWQWQGSPLDRDMFNGDHTALRKLAQEAEMTPTAITDETPYFIDTPANAPLYDHDGLTKLSTLYTALTNRLSLYGVGAKRAIFVTTGGLRRVALVTPSAKRQALPADCTAAISAAVAPLNAKIAAAKDALVAVQVALAEATA